MSDEAPLTVTIPVTEYARLMKAGYHLKLLKEWTGGGDNYQPWVIECAHPSCTACAVTVHDRSYILPEYHDCKRLTMCDHQTICSQNQGTDTYYCDKHAPMYFVDYYDQLKVEQDEWICDLCRAHRDKDIALVMSHAAASTQEAIDALQKHDGDIVLAIIDIQNSK